jgi:hypothetical protein
MEFTIERQFANKGADSRTTEYTVCRDGDRWGIVSIARFESGEFAGKVRRLIEVIQDRELLQVSQDFEDPPELAVWFDGQSAAGTRWKYLHEGGMLFGWLPERDLAPLLKDSPDRSGEFLWQLLRDGENLEVSPKREEIAGVPTWHVRGRGKHGEFSLWLDPAAGGLPRKIVHILVRQPEGNGVDPLTPEPEGAGRPKRDLKRLSRRQLKRAVQRFDNMTIERVGGIFVTKSFDFTSQTVFHDGAEVEVKTAVHVHKLDEDPARIEAGFRPSIPIPDGTPILVIKQPGVTREVQIGTEWRNGAIRTKK